MQSKPFEHRLVEDDAGEVKIVVTHPKGPLSVTGEGLRRDDGRTSRAGARAALDASANG